MAVESNAPIATSDDLAGDVGTESVRPKRLPLAPQVDSDFPLVPARIINEALYCERLMYLEWIQGEWADNYFTVDGRSVHKRVDKPGKPLTTPEPISEEGEP